MFTAMVFFADEWHSVTSLSAEAALAKLERKLNRRCTFRPADGTIYHLGSHIPCGVIFRKGYQDK